MTLERVRNAECAERGLERCLPALQRRADDADLLRGHAGSEQRQELLADQLERSALARALEEADGAFDLGLLGHRLGEERALEMCERRLRDIGEGRRQLLDATVGQAAQIVHRPAERRERRAVRLVGHRHGHLAAAGECLQERPLRAGQVLEAVREDRLAAPGLELSGDTFRRMPAQKIAVPHAEPVELPSICGIQRRELALEVVRVEQAGLELTHRRERANPRSRRSGPSGRGR